MIDDAPITPITLLSGFLGSGKTTFLNALLRDPDLGDTAVIVNELGEIGLDHLLLDAAAHNIALLDSGCLCCGMTGGLRETLLDLDRRRRSGEIPFFRRVIVETSGLADPAPAIQSLLRDRLITDIYAFEQLVTVVDAMFGADDLVRHPEARQQLALADRLLISKLDRVGEAAFEPLVDRLRGLNPLATIGRAGPGSMFKSPATAPAKNYASAPALRHSGDVTAHAFVIPGPIGWAGLAGWIELSRTVFVARMLRCKGLVEVRGAKGPVLIQGVQTVFARPETLPAWPDADCRSRLVCITQALPFAELEASLEVLHAADDRYQAGPVADAPMSPENMRRKTA